MAYESAAERTRKTIIEHIQQFGYLDNERLKLLTGILGSQNAHLSTHLTNLIKEGKLEVRVKKNKFILNYIFKKFGIIICNFFNT